VLDMKAVTHDFVLMGMDLRTNENMPASAAELQGLAGDFLPVDALRAGVSGEGLLVLNQHRAHDARINPRGPVPEMLSGMMPIFCARRSSAKTGLRDGGVGPRSL